VELTGTQQIRRECAGVWSALNDPDVLQQCIPGCESLTQDGENSYRIVILVAVGPVKARFNGKLTLADIREQQGYSLSFEGSGGAAGFGKGGAAVSLKPLADGTQLTYEANAKVGGKLAQVGSRLIDAVAAKMADEFFGRFKGAVEPKGARDLSGEDLANIAALAAGPTGVTGGVTPAIKLNKTGFIVAVIALVALVAVISYYFGSHR
jgi:carbon monoxide dehydrogenase subunit G